MSDEELLDFCKDHNVEISFSFDPLANGYHLRMMRGMFQINDILSIDLIHTSKEWSFVVKAILTSMVAKLNKYEEEHKNESG